jgi:3-hydroxyacyl-[acyl-carrier-protein] dehydratase
MGQIGRLIALDRITSIEPGKGATAIRNVPNTLAIFDTHFPYKPVLPGVLIVGSLGELAATLLREQTGQPWRLSGADRISFRHFVQPGDQMEVAVELKALTDTSATLTGTVRVEGKVVTQIRQLRLVPGEVGAIE